MSELYCGCGCFNDSGMEPDREFCRFSEAIAIIERLVAADESAYQVNTQDAAEFLAKLKEAAK